MSVAMVGAAATIGSAVIGSRAASKASKAQQQAASDANALSEEQFNKQVALNQPMVDSRDAANNRLMTLLGLTPPPSGPDGYEKNEANFDSEAYLAANPDVANGWDSSAFSHYDQYGRKEGRAFTPTQRATRQYQDNSKDPAFGSLMKDFSMADYQADPGLEFRRQQGEQGLTRARAASGLLGSGKYLKDAMSYNSGLASQEYGKAFDRFQVNRQNKLNPLQSLMGAGQTGANALGQASQNYANTAGNNILSAGDARAAGAMGSANAIAGGINSAWNNYSQNRLLQQPTYQPPVYDDGYSVGQGGAYGGTRRGM
jgi:hypothetical protein